MISAEVEAAVAHLLHEHGLKQLPGENLGDFVARGVDTTSVQANSLLTGLHVGNTIEEAQAMAGIEAGAAQAGLLVEIGRTIGTAIGKIATKLSAG